MYEMIQTLFRMASKPKRRRTKSQDVPQNPPPPPSQRLDTDDLARMPNLPEAPTADNCISENSFMTDMAYFFFRIRPRYKKNRTRLFIFDRDHNKTDGQF